MAKLKIEIFDHINPSKGESKAPQLDLLEKLFQVKKTVLPIDETKYLKTTMKCNIEVTCINFQMEFILMKFKILAVTLSVQNY